MRINARHCAHEQEPTAPCACAGSAIAAYMRSSRMRRSVRPIQRMHTDSTTGIVVHMCTRGHVRVANACTEMPFRIQSMRRGTHQSQTTR
ncbi:hypothetical protein FKM82_023014 [Ascaphus truei]